METFPDTVGIKTLNPQTEKRPHSQRSESPGQAIVRQHYSLITANCREAAWYKRRKQKTEGGCLVLKIRRQKKTETLKKKGFLFLNLPALMAGFRRRKSAVHVRV